jgi:hypothetical protein
VAHIAAHGLQGHTKTLGQGLDAGRAVASHGFDEFGLTGVEFHEGDYSIKNEH